MTYGAEIWGPALLSAAASGGSALLGNMGNKETKTQKSKRKLLDKLLASIEGEGPYSNLFNFSDKDFQKSFVEPAMNRFNNQIAPNIQQSYIAGGQQLGSGLQDQLLRSGVNMNDELNKYMLDYQENAKNRSINGINSILGNSIGGAQNMSTSQALGQGAAGFFSSDAWQDLVKGLFPKNQGSNSGSISTNSLMPEGFSK